VARESEEFEPDEDDYMLLQDNNITGIHRPKPAVSFRIFVSGFSFPAQIFIMFPQEWTFSAYLQGNKFKRLKKAGRESEMGEHSGFSDDNASGKRRTAEEKVQYSLFGNEGSCF
jgi:transcription elongation factor SPT6